MADSHSADQPKSEDIGWDLFEVWKKYEDIAMHFNDLLIKLRTQALAAVAALTTIIGIFAKSTTAEASWQMVAFAFAILIVFWIAIWILDFCYYNPLLIGAAEALFKIEKESEGKLRTLNLDLSITIRDAVAGKAPTSTRDWKLVRGRWAFYVLVFVALASGFIYSLCRGS